MGQFRARSFSLNIFQMNAVALIEASLHASDPDHGMSLMADENREAGTQAHREFNRHLHNFTASAMTLVDHTRVFMNENYADTAFHAAYQAQVLAAFKDDPLSQFIQKLRNYMVHKGLPNTEMFLDLRNDEKDGATIQTGIRIGTASLLEWDGWSPAARRYIEGAGKSLNVRSLAEEYMARVNRFHAGLESDLRHHHSADLAELERLQSAYQAQAFTEELAHASKIQDVSSGHEEASAALGQRETRLADLEAVTNDSSQSVLRTIKPVSFRARQPDFPSQRHTDFTLTDADITGDVVFWGPDEGGVPTLSYINHQGQIFGLAEGDYEAVDALVDRVLGFAWAEKLFSRKFVEDQFLVWSRSAFLNSASGTFAESLLAAAAEKIKPLSVWLPVDNLEIESTMDFGPVQIVPVTEAFLNDLEAKALALQHGSSERKDGISELFRKIRKDFQGSASIVIQIEAEPALAEEIALIIARDAIDLFRFFSPGAPLHAVLCPTALAGAAFVPGSTVLFIGDQGLSSMTSKMAAENVCRWRLRTRDFEHLIKMGIHLAGGLVRPDDLNGFERDVRASLITYSKGTTFSDPLDRLAHTLAAVEGVLLKHSMEPTEFTVADRMSFMLSPNLDEREEIRQNVRIAYRLRTRLRAVPLAPNEIAAIQTYVFSAHSVLATTLLNLEKFSSRAEFVEAVDALGVHAAASVNEA